jgi:general secretion pathway protein A
MYEKYYGLRAKPFAMTPDPAFLFPSRHHQFAAMMLEYGIANQAGFFLLTGEVGCGKTLLVRHLLRNLGDETSVGLIANTSRNFSKLLPWISLAFELPFRGMDDTELYEQLEGYLVAQYAKQRRVLLIVDEAQNLGIAMLEELRVLSNLNADKNLVLQTLLVGQPELREILRRRDMRQFAQRISIDYHLPALTRSETRSYVRHRLTVAGGNPELFEAPAIERAFECSGGVPRLLNQICDLALVYGFSDQRQRIDAETMEHVIHDRSQGGLLLPESAERSVMAEF